MGLRVVFFIKKWGCVLVTNQPNNFSYGFPNIYSFIPKGN